MMIKLSECGYPRRHLWITGLHILESIKQLVDDLATQRFILAPCAKCQRHERFEGTLRMKDNERTYQCVSCGDYIQVEMDETFERPKSRP